MQKYIDDFSDSRRYIFLFMGTNCAYDSVGIIWVKVIVSQFGDKMMTEEGV